MIPHRIICFDTETTGFKPEEGHKILEIGCIEIINGVKTKKEPFWHYINPERDIPNEAFQVHGISTEMVKNKPKFSEIAKEFLNFIGEDSHLMAHNADFDMKFINHELVQAGYKKLQNPVIDTLKIAKQKFPGSPASLDALCKRFRIDLSRRVKHGALLDAELLYEIYIELTGGSQIIMFSSGKSDGEIVKTQKKKVSIEYRDFTLSDELKQSHQKFISSNLKKNFWYE